MNNQVVVFGGDGFCGWPTSLYLSSKGYNVTIVDNLVRRMIDVELGCDSLTPIKPIKQRIETWKRVTGNKIRFFNIDLAYDYKETLELLKEIEPTAVVHFAEQRAAPYSMKSPKRKSYTVNNNINTTHNILNAIVESEQDIHLVHLGTTGYYGYSSIGMEIPEGYLEVKVDTGEEEKNIKIPYPPKPGSVYHMTKVMDAQMFQYYNSNDKLRITDLHQGIVWGTETSETELHEDLINRFDYEGDFGTVLNRFVVQAAVGHPLTVHGTGGQTRAFIHIKDTVQCVELAIANPPKHSDRVRIFNQTTEQHNIHDLADLVCKLTGAKIRYYKNPRNEDAENGLKMSCDNLLNLGLKPIKLEDALLSEVCHIAYKYANRCDKSKIICTSTWSKNAVPDRAGVSKYGKD